MKLLSKIKKWFNIKLIALKLKHSSDYYVLMEKGTDVKAEDLKFNLHLHEFHSLHELVSKIYGKLIGDKYCGYKFNGECVFVNNFRIIIPKHIFYTDWSNFVRQEYQDIVCNEYLYSYYEDMEFHYDIARNTNDVRVALYEIKHMYKALLYLFEDDTAIKKVIFSPFYEMQETFMWSLRKMGMHGGLCLTALYMQKCVHLKLKTLIQKHVNGRGYYKGVTSIANMFDSSDIFHLNSNCMMSINARLELIREIEKDLKCTTTISKTK